MTFSAHRQRMVDHFIWLEQRSPSYALDAMAQYRTDPNCPCPDILASIKAEKARRVQLLSSSPNEPSK